MCAAEAGEDEETTPVENLIELPNRERPTRNSNGEWEDDRGPAVAAVYHRQAGEDEQDGQERMTMPAGFGSQPAGSFLPQQHQEEVASTSTPMPPALATTHDDDNDDDDDDDEEEEAGPAHQANAAAVISAPAAAAVAAASTFDSDAGSGSGGVAAEDILLATSKRSSSLYSASDHRTVQWATTGLVLVLFPAFVLSMWASEKYRLVVLVGWMLVLGSFLVLFQLLREATRNPRVLPPIVHRWVRAALDECRNFVYDWRTQVLLLTYEGDTPNSSTADDDGTGGNYAPMEDGGGDENGPPRFPSFSRWGGRFRSRSAGGSVGVGSGTASSPRPRSHVFRALVQPLVPWIQRGRQQKKQQKKMRADRRRNNDPSNEEPHNPATEYSYFPPPRDQGALV
jgi:hypothetical protein